MTKEKGFTTEKLRSQGFTMIELLIVISIIGILSGLTINILNSNTLRAKPRDSQRVADLGKLQTALELYFADNRRYPPLASWSSVTALTALTSGSYISSIPPDPSAAIGSDPCVDAATYYYSYRTNANGSRYVLTARTELADTSNRSRCANLSNWSSGISCTVPSTVNCYGVQNP